LNDAVNRPEQLKEKLKEHGAKITIMAPNDVFGGESQSLDEDNAVKFWIAKYLNIESINLNRYDTVNLNSIRGSFEKYCKRIESNNSIFLIKMIRFLI
jgi:hypothetical protein